MSRTKKRKIDEAKQMDNIIDYKDGEAMKRLQAFIGQPKPLILELACGDGQYALSMAEIFPDKNFIGVDIQGERLWMGAKAAKEKKLLNVLLLRAHIDHLEQFFPKKSVSEIWITFPDPYPRKKQIGKRLSNEKFLRSYKQILKHRGLLHIKTDNDALFDYSIESLGNFGAKIDVCLQNIDKYLDKYPLLRIRTYFERKHRSLGKNIHYLNCRF